MLWPKIGPSTVGPSATAATSSSSLPGNSAAQPHRDCSSTVVNYGVLVFEQHFTRRLVKSRLVLLGTLVGAAQEGRGVGT